MSRLLNQDELEGPKIKPVVAQLSRLIESKTVDVRWFDSGGIGLLFENGEKHALVFERGEWKLGFRTNISAAEMMDILILEGRM